MKIEKYKLWYYFSFIIFGILTILGIGFIPWGTWFKRKVGPERNYQPKVIIEGELGGKVFPLKVNFSN